MREPITFDHQEKPPCFICGHPETDRCHVRSRGAGGGDENNILHMCREHHQMQHRRGFKWMSIHFPVMAEKLDQMGFEFDQWNKLKKKGSIELICIVCGVRESSHWRGMTKGQIKCNACYCKEKLKRKKPKTTKIHQPWGDR